MTPIGLSLLLLTGVGPLISWRRATRRNFVRNFRRPLQAAAVATFVFVLVWGLRSMSRLVEARALAWTDAYAAWADSLGRSDLFGILCVLFACFVMVTLGNEFHVGAMARRRSRGESYPHALVALTMRSKRRYGGYIVHLGIVFCFLAFAGTALRSYQPEVSLAVGDRTGIDQYSLLYTGSDVAWERDGAYVRSRATIVAFDRGDTVPPEKIAQMLALATANGRYSVQADSRIGSPRVVLRFASEADAKRFVGRHSAGLLAERVAVLPNRRGEDGVLHLSLGAKMRAVARVAPRMAMGVFKDVRAHFERNAIDAATVHTVPGQMNFEVRFDRPEARDRFVEAMAAGPIPGVLMAKMSDAGGAGKGATSEVRVEVVPTDVGIVLRPEIRFYAKHSSPTTEVAIHSTLEHDLYLAMRPQQGQRFITLLAIVFPFVSFLWLGAIIMVAGGAICMWPRRRASEITATQGEDVAVDGVGSTPAGAIDSSSASAASSPQG